MPKSPDTRIVGRAGSCYSPPDENCLRAAQVMTAPGPVTMFAMHVLFGPVLRPLKTLSGVVVSLGMVSHINTFHHKQNFFRDIRRVVTDTLEIARDEKQIKGNSRLSWVAAHYIH